MKTASTAYRFAARPVLAAVLLLTLPLVAMQVTDQVVWTLFDVAFMGTLVVGSGVLLELVLARTDHTVYRAAAGLALAAAFLLVWVNGAVGIIGSAGNAANLMYGGVLAVGIVGALVARFEPEKMARALFATALAQALVGALAAIAGLGSPASGALELLALNGFFVALWLASALLFTYAVQKRDGTEAAPGV